MPATDLLTLDEARAALRLPASDLSRDTELATIHIPAVTPVVEDIVGPVVERSVTETADGGTGSILLPSAAASITTVVEDGATLTAGDFTADLDAGIVYRGGPSSRGTWAGGIGGVQITYVAGVCADTSAVPAHIKLAARIILAALAQPDQQANRPEFGAAGEGTGTVKTPSGWDIPRRAYQLLEPDEIDGAGFA